MNRSLLLENNISQFVIRYGQTDPPPPPRKAKPKPISVSSQISLPSRYKRKTHLTPNEPLTRLPSYSLHTHADERRDERREERRDDRRDERREDKKDEKQYSRIPIDYLEERDSGNPADRIRGRVVYRGYAPKNTYFYFKTVKQLRLCTVGERDYRGEQVTFNSRFESGNLNAAVRIGSREYWLFMREDTNTHGLRQWFYFEMRSRRNCKIRLRIYKFSKRFSLYRQGMRPYVRTADSEWKQDGEKVIYQYDNDLKCFYLQFQYNFPENKEVYFATLPPYTYSMLNNYLDSLTTHPQIAVNKIGLSLGGLDINAITIHSSPHEKQPHSLKLQFVEQSTAKHHKEAIIVLARTHPGQTVSNWALENFISRVLQLHALTDYYHFYIIPMLNPDGVFLGNHRTGVLGQDLNRNFQNMDLEYFPQVQTVQNFVNSIQKKHKVAFLFDLHGHSAKKNIFAFGQECQLASTRYSYSRFLPKVLSDSIDSFKLDHCLFKASKEKTNTARVYFSNRYNLNAITFEQSYGLLDNGPIGINNWKNFGTALADALLVYLSLGNNREKKEAGMTAYLSHTIKAEKEALAKKKQLQQQREKQRQKQAERQRQELKMRLTVSKTEANEDAPQNLIAELMGRKKEKHVTQLEKIEQHQRSVQSESSQQSSQLSSGDEQLQLQQTELQLLKKDIFRVGIVNRQTAKRQLYSMAEKKVELGHHYADYSARLHHKNTSMVQRIFKFKSRQRVREFELPQSLSHREKGTSIELPAIKR